MLRLTHFRHTSASASRPIAIALLAFSQVVTAGPLNSGRPGAAAAVQARAESVEVEKNPRTVSPHRIAVSIESAPSMKVRKNQEYEVRWEVPSSGRWYIAISKRAGPGSASVNSWVEYRSWGGSQQTIPAKILSQELGPEAKCLITIWYDSADVDKKSAGQLTAMPFSGSTQTIIESQGKRSKQFVFEFKLTADQPVTAKVIVSRPA